MECNNTRGKTNCINEINEKEPYGTKHSPNNVTNIYTDWKKLLLPITISQEKMYMNSSTWG